MSQQRSILIVDDEEPILLAMTEYFTHRGFAVDCARSVREAERLSAAHPYAVVITDLRLTANHDRQGLESDHIRTPAVAIRVHYPVDCRWISSGRGGSTSARR